MRFAILGCIALAGATLTAAHLQEPAAYDAKAGLRLMRAINTAENAGRGNDGYVGLERLLTHPMMGGVAPSVTFNGHEALYMGQTVRLLVSADGQRYQAALVPPSGCGVAFFTDERGVIFEGKGLGCQ